MASKLQFVETRFEANANNGLGEWKAVFSKGETEEEASKLALAFKAVSGSPGLKSMGGYVPMNLHQVETRLTQLSGKSGDDARAVIPQLEHAKTALQARGTTPPQKVQTVGMRA
jgi:hypothetical protein